MNVLAIIEKHYSANCDLHKLYLVHVRKVMEKAVEIASKNSDMNLDVEFIKEACMLHDIGIFLTKAPAIFCFGEHEYIEHGYLGRGLLEKEGLPKHALVCERHTGVGLSLDEIERRNLPLPKRDMIPESLEEEIICVADKFYSKGLDKLEKEKSIFEVIEEMKKFGSEKRFVELCKKFKLLN